MGWPNTVPLPPLGEIRPRSIRIVVVLPEPFGPTKPQTVPIGTSKFAWETATRSPYRLLRSLTEIANSDVATGGMMETLHFDHE
jgi:hypothetical protein